MMRMDGMGCYPNITPQQEGRSPRRSRCPNAWMRVCPARATSFARKSPVRPPVIPVTILTGRREEFAHSHPHYPDLRSPSWPFRHFNRRVISSTVDDTQPKADSFARHCMKLATFRLSFAGRVFALAWLSVWLMAQTLCVHHCASLALAKGGGGECCAKKGSGAAKKAADSKFFPCSDLKTVKLEPKAVMADFTPVVLVPFQPDFILPLPATNLDPSLAHYVRALPRADFVFRPEVSLGAALRSLAPPALA